MKPRKRFRFTEEGRVLIGLLGVVVMSLASCATAGKPDRFDAVTVSGAWATREISTGRSFGALSSFLDSAGRYELEIKNANGKPQLAGPVAWRETESSGASMVLMPFRVLGALSGTGGPDYEVANQQWDQSALTLSASQHYLHSDPPVETEPVAIRFRSPKRGELSFRGKTYPLRKQP